MMLELYKAPYEDVRVPQEKWTDLKFNKPYNGGSLPIVIDDKGKTLTQSKAIFMLIARMCGFYPMDPEIAFVNDWMVDTYYDTFNDISAPTFAIQMGAA